MTILIPGTRQLGDATVTACPRSSLVLRLIRAQNDPAKCRIRDFLLALSDGQLKEGLGFSGDDICALRMSPYALPRD